MHPGAGGGSTIALGNVSVDIDAVNDAPTFVLGADEVVDEDDPAQSVTGFLTLASPGPANESGQTLDPVVVTNNNNALFAVQPAIDGAGTLTYTPAADAFGVATVTVTLTDDGGTGNGGEDETEHTFTITITADNDAPVAGDVTLADVEEDNPQVITEAQLLASTSDVDGPSVFVTSVSVNSGMGTLTGSGPWTFTPTPDWNGPVVLDFTVSDGTDTDDAQADFNVTAVNDAPELTLAGPQTIAEGDSVTLDTLITNLVDIDAIETPGDITLTISVPTGTLSGTGSTVSGGGSSITLEGSVADVLTDLATTTFSGIDSDPGTGTTTSFDMTVDLSDNGNTGSGGTLTDSGTITFTATDVGPTVDLLGSHVSPITEGTLFTLTLDNADDPAGLTADPITAAVIFWGDGSTPYSLTPSEVADLNAGTAVDVDHLFDDEADMVDSAIRVSLFSQGVQNPDTSPKEFVSAGVFPLVVTGVAPTGLLVTNGPYNEGATGASVTVTGVFDPSTDDAASLTYTFGFTTSTGFQVIPSASPTVAIPAWFLADNPVGADFRSVSVEVKDKDGLSNTYTSSVTVNNVAPEVAPLANDSAAFGNAYTKAVTFTDPGADDWTAVAEIDDGSSVTTVNLGPVGKSFDFDYVFSAIDTYDVTITVTDDDGSSDSSTFTVDVTADAFIGGRNIFYSGSSFDGGDTVSGTPGDTAIDTDGSDGFDETTAVASDKVALVAGVPATLQNYTSYDKGINGIMVDIGNLPRDLAGQPTISLADFDFKVGNTATPGLWVAPVAAASPQLEVQEGAGTGGSDRVVITFADGVIKNQWLQVTVLVAPGTGIASPNVHYWGNQIGETGVGNTATRARVDINDVFEIFNNPTGSGVSAGITNVRDIDRNNRVDINDAFIAFDNPTASGQGLLLFTPPAAPPLMGSGSMWSSSDSLFGDDDDDLFDQLLF